MWCFCAFKTMIEAWHISNKSSNSASKTPSYMTATKIEWHEFDDIISIMRINQFDSSVHIYGRYKHTINTTNHLFAAPPFRGFCPNTNRDQFTQGQNFIWNFSLFYVVVWELKRPQNFCRVQIDTQTHGQPFSKNSQVVFRIF